MTRLLRNEVRCAGIWGLIFGLALLSGCAGISGSIRGDVTTAGLARAGALESVPIVDPLALPENVSELAVQAVGLNGTPKQRMDRLRRWLQDADPRFEYTEDRTYPAGRFFETRKGDCFSFTNIFIALARALDVDAHYVFVRDVSMTREQGGGYIDTSHIAAEYGTGPRPEVVDYFRYPDERTLPEFRPLTDLEAAALFNSNLAVGQMMRGRAELAEEILAFLVAQAPALPELRNNLAVAMISQNHVAQARDVLQAALARFPTYAPLYTNALTVATAQGDENMAQSLESWGESVAEDNPLFVFGQGMRRFRRHDFSGAVERFRRVTRLQDQSAIAWAWLSRAENAAGKAEDSTEASRRALSLGSSDPRIQAILAPMSARSSSSK